MSKFHLKVIDIKIVENDFSLISNTESNTSEENIKMIEERFKYESDKTLMNKLIKASSTYNLATERTNSQLRIQTRKLFNDINYSPQSIIATCLSADASNKKDNNWKLRNPIWQK
jgi:hypothetical protein